MKEMLKSVRYLLLSIIALAPMTMMLSCGGSDDPVVPDKPTESVKLSVNETNLNFEQGTGEREVKVTCNVEYEVKSSAGWLVAKRNSKGNLEINVDENDGKNVRKGEIELTAKTQKATIEVSQLGWGKGLLLTATSAEMNAAGGEVKVEITTNIEYKYTMEGSWLKEKPASKAADHPLVTDECIFIADPNKNEERTGTITFSDKEDGTEFEPVVFTVLQRGMGTYSPETNIDIKDDVKVTVTSGEASSYQPGEGIEKSFDGDMGTIYHSNWSNSGNNYFPITLTYNFAEGTNMDYFVYYPRTSGYNGYFKEVDIEVKSNANARGVDEWIKVMSHDFKGSGTAAKVEFPEAQIGVTAVRFIVKSGYGDGQGFASCAEMEFYRKNTENFKWEELFSDASCSSLKEGITEQDIVNCNHAFFKNIAFYMYNDKYPREFRIAEFKPYPHPDEQAKTHKTNPYSLLDNMTGIAVTANEELVVFADLKGQSVSLRVQNLDKAGGDGFGGSSYPLSNGINKIKVNEKGLVYVMYHTPDYASLPAVKIHFATGTVNGYYDTENEALVNRAGELLNKATNKYFDVVGKYAHLTFPTARFKNHTKDLKKLIGHYDDIVYHQQLLMGLAKYDKMFKNRMYFNVMYHSYMYATSYHTGYHDDTLAELCNDENFAKAVWGPAHEVGHCNQTRPGLNWKGTTEVTNNIMSQYLQTTIFNADSRVMTEDMGSKVASNRYAKAWNGIIADGIAHIRHDDVFCRLIPFWQLELFMGKVNGKTPLQQDDKGGFYPDVFEHVRMNDNLSGPGAQQLEFVYIACKHSGYNLLDFFEKWGFLREVDNYSYDDYGAATMNITKADADAIRSRVEALGYPEPGMAVEYISDNNYKYFKEKAAVVKGTSTRSDKTVTMTNWKNVVVYELRKGSEDGKLIAATEGVNSQLQPSEASFDFRQPWEDDFKIYAVQYDNARIEVTF